MNTCLTDIELQGLADGELPAERTAHVESCASCRERLEERRAALGAFRELMDGAPVPLGLGGRVMASVARAGRAAGATTLRPGVAAPRWPRRLALATVAAGVVILVVFALLPRLGAPTQLSASEVIGRSLQALDQVSGVERLEYDLRYEGFHSDLLGGEEEQALVIRQTIDHDTGRFLIAKYATNGRLVAGIAEDPVARVRTMIVATNGRRYVAKLRLGDGPHISIPVAVRTVLRTWLAFVQASGSRNLTLATTDQGGQFIVQAPQVPGDSGGVWGLEGARIVIDARDYHLVSLDTRGHLFGSPYHVTFLLRHRQVDASAPDSDFVLPGEPGDLVLEGDATDNPFWDVGMAALRRLDAVR
jgi:hypothetical protein